MILAVQIDMKANPVLLGLFFCITNAVAQKGLQCFVPGECLDSQILGATPTNVSRECWRHCQSTTGCTWFTFYKDSQICTLLSGCLRLSNEKCQDNCVSGEEECPEVQCGVHGRCYGALEGIRKVANAEDCATICRHREECFWNTYDPEHESCLMTNDCPLLDRSCSNCSSSERDCFVEIDSNMNTQKKDNTKARKNLVLGTTYGAEQFFFNLDTKKTEKCELPIPNFWNNVQYVMVSDDLHACGESQARDFFAVACYKLDIEKKAWELVESLELKPYSVLFSLSVPDKGILILVRSKFLYLFNGRKIYPVSDTFPYASLQTGRSVSRVCVTTVSREEILVGFSRISKDRKTRFELELHSMNINTGAFNRIKSPEVELTDSVCGAFGPEGNREVVIFAGSYFNNSQKARFSMTKNFDKILILDWNSKTFQQHHGTYFNESLNLFNQKTIAYGDTFVYFGSDMDYTYINEFDFDETVNPFVSLAKTEYMPMNLVEISRNMVWCE